MRSTIQAKVCAVRYCGRLVCAALPLTVLPPFHFDTKIYCSPRCAEMHSRGEHRTPSGPLITCDVCCEDKPLIDYIRKVREHDIVTEDWNLPIPSGCLPHLAPELLNMRGGTCTDCLRSHIVSQFETRGAINISCIQSHRTLPGLNNWELERLLISQDWLPYASRFLPRDLHDLFHQQLLDHYIHTTAVTLWTCPSNCGYNNGFLQPDDTPGFPHVECPGCHGRFCANCRVPWHNKQTCQQYGAEHPELRDKGEVMQLHEMARLGARRCPRCQFIIVKDGGCDHIHCEQCRFDFIWPDAERVVAPPPAYVPAPVGSDAAKSFRGWGQLRQVQEEHISRNRIADRAFDISNTTTLHEEGTFYYDAETALWSPDVCELDVIAGRAAGRRYVRQPSRDRDGRWAFVAAESGQQGGITLHEALRLELQFAHDQFDRVGGALVTLGPEGFLPPVFPFPDLFHMPDNIVDLRTAQVPIGLGWPPLDTDGQGGDAGEPSPAALTTDELNRLTNDLATAQEDWGVEVAAGEGTGGEDADGNGSQEEDANEQTATPLFALPWGPPRDATDAMIDQMLLTAVQAGTEGRFVFGFGLGLLPMPLLEGGEEDGGEADPDRDPDSE